MRRYEPIKPMDDEAAARSMTDADRLRQRWDDLRASLGEDRVRAAVDRERWRAAVETGVIERLYDVSPGVTEAIVRDGLEADEARALDDDVFNQIAAHRHAEAVVVDAVRSGRDLTTSLVRELHAAVTHAQPDYTAYDQFGRAYRRPLAHGEYKDHDNHVELPDGTSTSTPRRPRSPLRWISSSGWSPSCTTTTPCGWPPSRTIASRRSIHSPTATVAPPGSSPASSWCVAATCR